MYVFVCFHYNIDEIMKKSTGNSPIFHVRVCGSKIKFMSHVIMHIHKYTCSSKTPHALVHCVLLNILLYTVFFLVTIDRIMLFILKALKINSTDQIEILNISKIVGPVRINSVSEVMLRIFTIYVKICFFINRH